MTQKKYFVMMLVIIVCMPVGMIMPVNIANAQPIQDSTATAEMTVYGWINETGTGTPIQATVYFADMYGYGATNSTVSNLVTGYYSLNLTVTNYHYFLMHGINTAYKLNQTDAYIDESWPSFHMDMQLELAPPRSSSLSGYLLDAVTGLPLVNRSMTAASEEYLNSTVTNATGYYSMGFIPGEYTMGASSDGYESTSIRFTLAENWTIWRNITLEPLNCTLRGFVKGSGGPLDNAYVYVEEPWNVNPYGDDYSNYTISTGYYEFNLTRGTKNVGFRNDGYFTTSRPITLQAGDNWLNVTLTEEPADDCTVRGYVSDLSTSNPVHNASIRVGNINNTWGNGTIANATGYYEVNVIASDLRMEAEYWDYDAQYVRNGTKLTIMAGQTLWQNFTLTNYSEPQASLRGNVTLDGVPIDQASINMNTWSDRYGVSPDPSGYYEMDFYAGYAEFSARSWVYDKTSNIESLVLVLQPNETYWHDFDLYSLDFDSVLVGRVTDQGSQAVEGCLYYFTNGVNSESTFQTASISDFNGTYEIGLPTGENIAYMALALGYEMQTGEFVLGQEWNWNNITLQSLGTMVTIRGYLTDLEYNPISGHEMMTGGTGWMNWTGTNTSGYYETEVPMGDVLISSQVEGYYDPGNLYLNTGSGNDVWLNISVRPKPLTYEIRGTVKESDSTPVPDATVFAESGDSRYQTMTDFGGNYTLLIPGDSIEISVRADGYGTGEQAYVNANPWNTALSWQNLTLDRGNAWFEGPMTEYLEDIDGDGKYDWLYLNVTVNASVAGSYSIDGNLYQSEWNTGGGGMFGGSSARASNEDKELGTGPNTVTLAFSGPQIFLVGSEVNFVELLVRDNNWNTLDRMIKPITSHDFTEFDSPDIEMATPRHTFGPIDTDFDGLYNLLLFNTTVEVLEEGDYAFMGQLYNVPSGSNNRDMQELDSQMTVMHLAPGNHTIEFAFSGTAIYNSGWHLGLASFTVFNNSIGMSQSSMVAASQAYVPYDYRQFQSYPVDSMVYGWVNDSGNSPIENLRVEIYNVSNRYVNVTHTNATGYYELGGWEGSWLLVMDDDDETFRSYQGNLTTVPLTSGVPLRSDRIMLGEVLDGNILGITFALDDWNNTVINSRMDMFNDNQTIRYDFDVYEFGNGDGFISESEVDMLMGFLGAMINMPANLTDYMNVDGFTYELDAGSTIYDIGLVGSVTSKDSVYIHQKANYTATVGIPVAASHELNVNLSYDDTFMGSMSEVNSTFVCHVVPPTGWGRTGNKTTANITFSGTDYITVDPGTDPNLNDSYEYEWANITISDSQVPTVGTISGNVTLDGRTDHSGVTVKVVNATTGIQVASGNTDSFGFYTIPGMPPGTYNVTAEKAGYAYNTTSGVDVTAGNITWVPNMVLNSYPPTISNLHYFTTVSNDTAITIYADVIDDGTVGNVTLMYSDVLGVNHSLSMTKLGGVTYRATIPAQIFTGNVTFYIIANDTIGNSARLPVMGNFTITVEEHVPPVLSNPVVISNPTEYGDSTNITVSVSDASAISSMWLYNSYTSANTSMNSTGGGNYYLNDTYLALGAYNFTIWATDSFGNVASVNGAFFVQDTVAPIADAGPNQTVDQGTIVTFNGSSSIDLVGIVNYAWNFIDSSPVTLWNVTPTHQFDTPGIYIVTLTATDSSGNNDTDTMTVTVNDTVAPVANAGINQIINEDTLMNFDGSASTDNVGIVNYTWTFTDGVPVTLYEAGPTYQFDDFGMYVVTLTVTDAAGNIHADTMTVTALDNTPPAISDVTVNPAASELGVVVNISANISDLAGMGNARLLLQYPNGTVMSNTSMTQGAGDAYYETFSCDIIGNYQFTIWATDTNNKAASASGSFWVNDTVPPTIENLSVPATVEFGDSVNITVDITDNAGMKNVTIQVFDPVGIELFNNTMNIGSYWYLFTPDETGTYNFTIWAIDGNDMVNSTKSSFAVVDTIAPEFQSVTVIPQTQEVLDNVAVRAIVDDLDSVVSCYLNLTAPDGTWLSNTSMTLTGNNWSLNRTYGILGVYHFTLWARDPSGNFNSTSGVITTEDTQSPVANAGIDRTVPIGTQVSLNASASTDNYGIANYTWTLTDNGVQTLYGMAVPYTFTTIGTYDVLLTVMDHAGLTSTDTKIITVTGVQTTGTVTGTVLNSDGVPIASVTVYVKDSVPRIEDTTDNTGSFILENVPQGNQTIVFVHDDYKRQEIVVTVVAGGSVSTGDIT
ncbi:MAG: carboxypeptidase regulatory-like domain-containing protein, partial [Candidatus Thermoplasmatota archaeon]|nr:carboxypeptidase regulatory-like domain-containing protein [Candidatus Thermoplasmatota archaeon]